MNSKSVLFCGPSGSGKTTIVHHLLKNNPQLSFSISATTRPKRENETNGVDYHFLSVEDFKKQITCDEFIEWEEVYKDRFYGTLKSEVGRIWGSGKVVVFDVDVEGGLNIKKKLQGDLLAVFVQPPSLEELHKRLSLRMTETPESFQARIEKSDKEMLYASNFDKTLVNDTLEDSFRQAQKMLNEFLNLKSSLPK
jgi:guanylate kinase